MIKLDRSQIMRETVRKRAEALVLDCHAGNKDKHVDIIAYALLEAAYQALEAATALDVYMTEGEHGDLDLTDGERCFDAGVKAYREALREAALSARRVDAKD